MDRHPRRAPICINKCLGKAPNRLGCLRFLMLDVWMDEKSVSCNIFVYPLFPSDAASAVTYEKPEE